MKDVPIEEVALELAERWHIPPWAILQAPAADVFPFLEALTLRAQFARALPPAGERKN